MAISETSGVTIVLEHNNGGRKVADCIDGKGSTFTYQVIGAGTASIYGSNVDGNWIPLIDAPLTAPSSVVLIHSWRFIKVEGDATVIVSRGGVSPPFDGNIYGLIGIARLTTDAETLALENAIAKQTGVTLNV